MAPVVYARDALNSIRPARSCGTGLFHACNQGISGQRPIQDRGDMDVNKRMVSSSWHWWPCGIQR